MPAQHEGQLLLYHEVLARQKYFLHQLFVVQLQSESHGQRELVELPEDSEGRLEQVCVLRLWDVGDTAGQVETHAVVGSLAERQNKK